MNQIALDKIFEKPWLWAFVGAACVWLATIIFTGGQGAGQILSAALSFGTFFCHRRHRPDVCNFAGSRQC